MKFLLISAALVAVAFASPTYVKPEVAGPAPVDQDYEPINVGPAIIDGPIIDDISVAPGIVEGEYEDISVGPAIIDGPIIDDISVAPGIVDGEYEDISVGPAIIDGPIIDDISIAPGIVGEGHEDISVGPAIVNEPAVQAQPLVSIVVNINSQSHVIDVPHVAEDEVEPTPVIIDDGETVVDPVVVVEEAEEIEAAPAPGIIGKPELPIVTNPVITVPETLN